MSEVMRRIKLAQLESELMDVQFDIRKHEGIINSPNIKSKKFKDSSKKTLIRLIKEKNRLSAIITEAVFLDLEI